MTNVKRVGGLQVLVVLSLSSVLSSSCGDLEGDVASIEGAASTRHYTFAKLAAIGDPAPGPEGGTYGFDFEPGALNNRGSFSYAADVTTGGEGVFLGRGQSISQVVRSGEPAPGGGTLGPFGIFGQASLNDPGDMAFAFNGDPFLLPVGINSGVYRFSSSSGTTTALLVPDVTSVPGGGVFRGTAIHAAINNGGEVVFSGMTDTTAGIASPPSPPNFGLGMGVYRANRKGVITKVVAPGDLAPGGCNFDFAQNPWISDPGSVAFGGHVACDPCIDFGAPQTDRIFCAESVYLQPSPAGPIVSVAHQGDAAPGGGTFQFAFGPVMNNRGDVVFIGDLGSGGTPSPAGVFLYSHGALEAVARPGDSMPGGGHLATASFFISNYSINDAGDVAFDAALDTSTNGTPDSGLYVRVGRTLELVARTGTVIPGVGTIASLQNPALPVPSSGALVNARRQVFFTAILGDGGVVLLLATP